jgi:hypothetical protein
MFLIILLVTALQRTPQVEAVAETASRAVSHVHEPNDAVDI